MTNDIALLKLSGNGINVGASDVELMCLPVGNDASFSQTECIIAGWGWTRKTEKYYYIYFLPIYFIYYIVNFMHHSFCSEQGGHDLSPCTFPQ